jgi:hypothetical protein
MIAKKADGVRKARKSASPANVTARWDDLGRGGTGIRRQLLPATPSFSGWFVTISRLDAPAHGPPRICILSPCQCVMGLS